MQLMQRGQAWYPLASLPGYAAQFNPAEQSLQLNFSPGAFATTRLGRAFDERPAVSKPLTSLFLNYDASYTRSDLRGASVGVSARGMTKSFGSATTAAMFCWWLQPKLGNGSFSRVRERFSFQSPQGAVLAAVRVNVSVTGPRPR